jgi:ABC-type phosphate transport system permease subunit
MSTSDLAITQDVVVARSLRGRRVDVIGSAFQIVLLASLFIALAALVVLVSTVFSDGLPVFRERGFVVGDFPSSFADTWDDIGNVLVNPRGIGWIVTALAFVGLPVLIGWLVAKRRWKVLIWSGVAILAITALAGFVGTSDFLTSPMSRIPERAGVGQAIFGTIMLAVFTAVVALPLGVATAVYLEEYAPANRFTSFVRLNIRNLAGVPSVVYGLLGLALFVQLAGTDIDTVPVVGGLLVDVFGESGITGGKTIIAGGLALAILVLPIVIITASEAIRAVPQALREGGYGVGATKWEVIKTLVVPNAFAGILTGTILSLSRAIGETAPLILVGAFYGTFFTTGSAGFYEKFDTTYTALPQVVYQWVGEPSEDFKVSLAAAAIVVLLVITLFANLTAVLLRNRYEKRW